MTGQGKDNSNIRQRYEQEKEQLFSSEALDKMRSPEKLDSMMLITSPVHWMGLIAMAVLVISLGIWSVFGSFTVKAEGMGMIMDPNGVARVAAPSGGTVTEIFVRPGEMVEEGQRIAHVQQVQREADTRMAQYASGLSTSARDAAGKVHEYDSRRYQQNATEYVCAPYAGIVDEIFIKAGGVIGMGNAVCNLRLVEGRNELQGVLYVPADKGKRVEPGLTVQLAPNGVDVARSGSLVGTVRSVSQYPVSLQSLQKDLANEQLAQWILQSEKSAVMEVDFDLVRDDADSSGYLWTSAVGEHKAVTAGSFCTGSIIIEKQPPIQKVFYKLSQWLRSR